VARHRIRLRKWGTAILLASTLTPGGSDPLDSALDWQQHLASYADRAERTDSIQTGTSRSSRSALPGLLVTILDHETSGRDYEAYNPTGCSDENGTFSCGGAYQLSAQYATVWGQRAGYPHLPANAATWPPATQDAVAIKLYYSTTPDGAHWCDWTDYC
jgi:hypothetical protein